MNAMAVAIGFTAGYLFCRLLVAWDAMWRVCCRDHYKTHATCPCRDCRDVREAESR